MIFCVRFLHNAGRQCTTQVDRMYLIIKHLDLNWLQVILVYNLSMSCPSKSRDDDSSSLSARYCQCIYNATSFKNRFMRVHKVGSTNTYQHTHTQTCTIAAVHNIRPTNQHTDTDWTDSSKISGDNVCGLHSQKKCYNEAEPGHTH